MENSNRIKDGNGRLALEEAEVRRIWKEYYEDLYNIDIQEQIALGGKLLNGIKSMYVKNLACVRVKEDESECFRTDSGVRQGCIMSSWLFNVYMDAMMKKVKMGMGRKRVKF